MTSSTTPREEGRRVGWLDRRIESTETGAGNRRWYGGLLAALIALGIWWAVAATGRYPAALLPPPQDVWDAFVQSITVHDGRTGLSGEFLWTHLLASLKRVLLGLVWNFLFYKFVVFGPRPAVSSDARAAEASRAAGGAVADPPVV